MSQKGFVPILVAILIAIVSLGGYLAYQWVNKSPSTPPPNQVACTQEAKLCPDGSSVGRSGSKCDFAPCPTPSATSSADISNWKTYTNTKYHFSFKYPANYKFDATTEEETHDPSYSASSPDYQSWSAGVNPEDNKERQGIYFEVFVCQKTPCYYIDTTKQKDKRNAVFQNKSGVQYEYLNTHSYNQIVLDITNGNSTYTLTLDVGSRSLTIEDKKLFEAFLSTFRFLP